MNINWILIPPSGRLAISRRALNQIPEGGRLATGAELFAANLGRPFPWGTLNSPEKASRLWKKHRIGIGGMIHDRWFVTSDGRLGGAPNVPESLPGSLRSCLLIDGGFAEQQTELAENEGFAVVCPSSDEDQAMYRSVQLHAAEHVVADGGSIIVSPVGKDGTVYSGFVGRCMFCPNAELISFRQLCSRVPGYRFELWPEWRNWTN